MAIVAKHLKCDCEKITGGKCPNNLWSPKRAPQPYWHCPNEGLDFLCDSCIRSEFIYDKNGNPMMKKNLCPSDNIELEERVWPSAGF